MNESAARQALLVRAFESAEDGGNLLTPEDRAFAGRAAAELVRWQAAERGEAATEDAYVAKRAELLSAKLVERSPATARTLRSIRWRPWIGLALPVLALATGILADQAADRKHVSILAFPLLGVLVWSFAVYLWLAARARFGLAAPRQRKPGWLRRQVAGVRADFAAHAAGTRAAALAGFGLDWLRHAEPLVAARAGRVLHLSAALLALGAVAGMYVRGLAFEYRAGWESTFLDASAVQAIVQFLLFPAAWILGQTLPGVERIAELRWDGGASGENAARWIHLWAVTVLAAVILPRLLLAWRDSRREASLSARFPLSFDEPYFRRVLSGWRESPAHVRVRAYAYSPSEAAAGGLEKLAARLFGEDVRVHHAPPVAYGGEDDLPGPDAGTHPPDLVIALFNLATTPETENHGVFLDALEARSRGAFAMVVDESPYRGKLGAQAGAPARLAERRQAWTGFAQARDVRPVFVDLTAPDIAAAERELDMLRSTQKARA